MNVQLKRTPELLQKVARMMGSVCLREGKDLGRINDNMFFNVVKF